MKILFSGGGTLGPVMPLLAIAEEIKNQNPGVDFYWLGTKRGPEKKIITGYNIDFNHIPTGKLRRYFSLNNIFDIFKILAGFVKALIVLISLKPKVIISAGGFVAVPVVWAGWLLGIKSLIHQQDIKIGLANKLCFPAASIITVCFPASAQKIRSKKVKLVGNPVRANLKNNSVIDKNKILSKYDLLPHLPLLVVTTGGRGSKNINKFIFTIASRLTQFCQIIHIAGVGKLPSPPRFEPTQPNAQCLPAQFLTANGQLASNNNYHICEFILDDTDILKAADLVIARAGMSTLTELAYLKKPAIIIPLPDSHQELNAEYFAQRQAIELFNQNDIDVDIFINRVKNLLAKKRNAKQLGTNMHQAMLWGAEIKLAQIILNL